MRRACVSTSGGSTFRRVDMGSVLSAGAVADKPPGDPASIFVTTRFDLSRLLRDEMAQLGEDELLEAELHCPRRAREREHDDAAVQAADRARQHRRRADVG